MNFDQELAISLFGSMQICVGGQPVRRLRTRKGYWLLALLTLHHGREVQREWLAGLLWPESWESQARANLNLSLTDLRKALGSEAVRLQSVTLNTLRLDLSGAECDLLTFDRLAAHQDRAGWECAVSLCRSALLEDCYEPWASTEREAREQTCLRLLENLAAEAAEREDWRLAAHTLRVVVRRDPYRDSAQMQLMQALSQAGDTNAALQVYQEFMRFLRNNDLQARPSPELEQLSRQIRSGARQRAELSPVSPPAAPILLSRSSVPARITPLIGREQDILQIAMALRRSRLVTLTGAGGVGKTSLATVVASEEAGAYPYGAAFVELDVLTDPAEIPDRILSALGVQGDPRRPPAETLTEFLAEKAMLLVLDNLEHLMSAGAAQVQDLLRRCPGLVILVTSRQALGIADEVTWRVPSLSVPDPQRLPSAEAALLDTARSSDAVRLFAERAGAKQADFRLNGRSARAVIEICSKLDGIPFAIELAAARAASLPVTELARRLQDCYRVLSGVNAAALPRHQTLTALMDWSYRLLTQAEQVLLLRLSVFRGGFSLEAAEAVCAHPPVAKAAILGLLDSLVNKSLAVYEERDGSGRYRLLETVKQYAAERLLQVAGAGTLCQSRHADYFLALAEEQEPHLNSEKQVAALDLLDLEYDNFQAALLWSTRSPEALETACRLASALSYFWTARGHLLGGRRWFDVLMPCIAEASTQMRVKFLLGAAYMACVYGDPLQHRSCCDAALELCQDPSNRLEYARCLVMKSRNWMLAETEGLELLRESLAIFRAKEDALGIADALSQMATKRLAEIDSAQRIAWFEECILLYRERRDYRKIAVTVGELGYAILRSGGDNTTACALYEEMLDLSIQVKDGNSRSHALWLLGGAAGAARDDIGAERYYTEGLELIRQIGGKNGTALLLFSLASVKQRLGKRDSARILAEESLALYRDLGYPYYVEGALQLLSQIGEKSGSD